ncbi:YggS family pyridoxal phosphate-dependent enzyme [Flavimarina sp. Hel_I_48]|uniref:YggS family pyridoxal phosphate-dependent enzyme n=1 Tax=Flavimarina sp. Hel_I_48 TaxID=1392488 RepID=UPI0004DF9CDF|nr:YggS family pyridoxal phosphate-dependent enzyme [Flavimarina sp. Hel_I_48]
MDIAANIKKFRSEISDDVILVAISKTKPNEDLQEAYDAGQRIFGENRIQEMSDKSETLPKDIEWHMVGHVQTNKVKDMAPYVSLVHSADRPKLFKEINKEAEKNDRTIKVLLQVKIAEEDSKYGMPFEKAEAFLKNEKAKDYPHVKLMGLMGMATFTDDEEQVTKEFKTLKELYERFKESNDLTILSTGMSGDYKLGLAQGSNMIRIGSSIFGKRG